MYKGGLIMSNVKILSIEYTGTDYGFEGKTVQLSINDNVKLHLSDCTFDGKIVGLDFNEIEIALGGDDENENVPFDYVYGIEKL